MAKNAAMVLIETIMNWGVDTVFGLPGDGINGIMEALREHKDRVRFIQVRHEEGAAFMACAYAKYTGRLGCCLATMAPGLPYTVAAAVAYPGRQCIAFVGDGAFTMLMGEFATAVKYNLPILVVLIKNNVLGQIKWEQIVFLGNPEYGVQLQPIDFAKYAEACGGVGITVTQPQDIRPAFERALASGKPAVVEVVVDANEPPMPPKVSFQQAEHFAEALLRGEPRGGEIVSTIFKDKVRELV